LHLLRDSDRESSQRGRPQQDRSSAGTIRIGTSGWHYGSWRGVFFPKEVRIKDHLRYYAEHFPTCEHPHA
jgi:hypothetical protein